MTRCLWKSPIRNEQSAIFMNDHARSEDMKPTLIRITLFALAMAAPAWAGVRWSESLRQPDKWYASPEARALADHVVLYQTVHGGWPKNKDMAIHPSAADAAKFRDRNGREATIDNGATTMQLDFLARVIGSGRDTGKHKAAFLGGLDYLLDAQYENGGWPQYFPLRKGYHSRITFNDNAMIGVLAFLGEIAKGGEAYGFVDGGRRERSRAAVERGIDCILRTQIRQDGKPTAWCAQHDENTLKPAWARNYEPPSLSGSESVGIVRFLMGIEKPSPDIIAAVEGAVHWFESVGVRGLRIDGSPGADGKPDRRAVSDSNAPVLWARFYEIGTNRPMFMGRDKVARYGFNEIERERRTGYAYFGRWPAELIGKDYPKWKKRN
jgi:PelA/Pel-15E family pectate lyase